MKKPVAARINAIFLALVVFISSTGFVSVEHFCSMNGSSVEAVPSCVCDDECDERGMDNCIKTQSCCFEKSSYLINAVASIGAKTISTIDCLTLIPVLFHDFLNTSDQPINPLLYTEAPPDLITGRILLLRKSSLLI